MSVDGNVVTWNDPRLLLPPCQIAYKNLHKFRVLQMKEGLDLTSATDEQWGLLALEKCHHISTTSTGKDGPQSFRVRICKTCCQEDSHIELGTYVDQESAILVNDTFEILNGRLDKLIVLRAEDRPFLHLLMAKKYDRSKGRDYALILDLISERVSSIEEKRLKSSSSGTATNGIASSTSIADSDGSIGSSGSCYKTAASTRNEYPDNGIVKGAYCKKIEQHVVDTAVSIAAEAQLTALSADVNSTVQSSICETETVAATTGTELEEAGSCTAMHTNTGSSLPRKKLLLMRANKADERILNSCYSYNTNDKCTEGSDTTCMTDSTIRFASETSDLLHQVAAVALAEAATAVEMEVSSRVCKGGVNVEEESVNEAATGTTGTTGRSHAVTGTVKLIDACDAAAAKGFSVNVHSSHSNNLRGEVTTTTAMTGCEVAGLGLGDPNSGKPRPKSTGKRSNETLGWSSDAAAKGLSSLTPRKRSATFSDSGSYFSNYFNEIQQQALNLRAGSELSARSGSGANLFDIDSGEATNSFVHDSVAASHLSSFVSDHDQRSGSAQLTAEGGSDIIAEHFSSNNDICSAGANPGTKEHSENGLFALSNAAAAAAESAKLGKGSFLDFCTGVGADVGAGAGVESPQQGSETVSGNEQGGIVLPWLHSMGDEEVNVAKSLFALRTAPETSLNSPGGFNSNHANHSDLNHSVHSGGSTSNSDLDIEQPDNLLHSRIRHPNRYLLDLRRARNSSGLFQGLYGVPGVGVGAGVGSYWHNSSYDTGLAALRGLDYDVPEGEDEEDDDDDDDVDEGSDDSDDRLSSILASEVNRAAHLSRRSKISPGSDAVSALASSSPSSFLAMAAGAVSGHNASVSGVDRLAINGRARSNSMPTGATLDRSDIVWSILGNVACYRSRGDPLSVALRKYYERGGINGTGYVGIYSPEDRRQRIERFLEKRKRRMWAKKVKYDVRKNFADSRVRIKGRFVKKNELLATAGTTGSPEPEQEAGFKQPHRESNAMTVDITELQHLADGVALDAKHTTETASTTGADNTVDASSRMEFS